jgi:hypothetical protein
MITNPTCLKKIVTFIFLIIQVKIYFIKILNFDIIVEILHCNNEREGEGERERVREIVKERESVNC